ncbi:MAG: hypothetical protein DSY80_09955 [Desulfocapsa sp.]|nr:MAG: hypothetical protein DSY80_09955 [Desulfocapsa sp.]
MRLSKIELVVTICIIVCGISVEYAYEFVMTKGVPAQDVFPPQISQLDSMLMLKVNPSMLNPVLNPIFITITHLGSTLAIVLFGIILYVSGYKREGVLILVSVIIGSIVVASLKILFHRPRPYLTLQEVIPLKEEAGVSFSFPSGHSEKAFALATILSNSDIVRNSRIRKLAVYAYATLVTFSRVYIGVHYPLDVIAGSILGWIVGKVTLKIEDKILPLVQASKGD